MIEAQAHSAFRELVDGHRHFLVTTHMNPDGDGIGSQLCLARFLRSLGREVRMVNQDATPTNLRFLKDEQFPVEVFNRSAHLPLLREVDLAIMVDNSAPDRLGRMEEPMLEVASKTLCIDHHPTRETPWAHNVLDQEACATAAVVYELVTGFGWEPDKAAAEALYVGIATDTGFFRFNSTNAQAHEISARLFRLGVDPAKCYQEIHERNSEAYTRLLGHALADLRLDGGGTVAAVRITQEMVDRCRAGKVDTSEITTSLLSMYGVWVALLFRELRGGRVKVSLRSKGNVDVHQLATQFGGGGHRNASGIVIDGELDDVLTTVSRRAAALVAARSGE